MLSAVVTRIKKRIQYHQRNLPLPTLLLLMLRDGIAKLGVDLLPYYLLIEKRTAGNTPLHDTQNSYRFGDLEAGDMQAVAALPGITRYERSLVRRLQDGKLCFGAWDQDQLVAVTWCSFDACIFRAQRLFALKADEAYLFDAYTVASCRGKGLAPALRFHCYEELAKRDKARLYSLSFFFNRPSIRFKQKLSARIAELWLFVELFGRLRYAVRLKRYPDAQ